MKAGKLSESVLNRSVIRQLHSTRPGTLSCAAVGVDYAAAELPSRETPADARQGGTVVCSVGTMPLSPALNPAFTVYNALNNLACSGGEPLGILVNLLLPTSADEQTLRDIICGIDAVCGAERIQVLGGHTEVVRSVTEPTLTVTAVGGAGAEELVCGRVRPGMDILVTKWVGLAGTAILAREREADLRTRYSQTFIDSAKRFDGLLSVRPEADAARRGAAVMHDISEGGIYGALWELGQRSGLGLEIDLKKIPIRQETVELCEFFDLNPYKMLSTGSLLIASSDGNALVQMIVRAGGNAAVIGKATDGSDRVVLCGDERRFLETTRTDELWKLSQGRRADIL